MKKSRIISLALAVLVLAACLVSCKKKDETDWDYIKNKGEMVVGITIYEPMNYYEDENAADKVLTGFDTEFTRLVCNKLGIKPNFQIINWSLNESELKAKNVDCLWNGLTVTEERKASMDFSRPYLVNKQVIVISKDNADKYKTLADFEGAIITAENGSAGNSAIKADEHLSKATYTGSESQATALLALQANNVDAAVIDYTMAKSTVGNGDYENYTILDLGLADEKYAIGFRVGSDMTEKVNKAIDELINDGSLKSLAEKYNLLDEYNEAVGK